MFERNLENTTSVSIICTAGTHPVPSYEPAAWQLNNYRSQENGSNSSYAMQINIQKGLQIENCLIISAANSDGSPTESTKKWELSCIVMQIHMAKLS